MLNNRRVGGWRVDMFVLGLHKPAIYLFFIYIYFLYIYMVVLGFYV